jgi:Tfp pilus assembly protein PilF
VTVSKFLFESSGDLLTSGLAGVWRWPIRAESGRATVHIDPPSRLPLPPSALLLAEDRAGRVIALADTDRVHLLRDGRPSRIGPVDRVRYVAVSPDGQWLATGEHVGGAQVWRLPEATKVADLPYAGLSEVHFSPDGKWLIANGGACRLWEVGTWRELRRIGGRGFAFAPNSRLLVVQDPSHVIRLVETETGRTLARLESPDLCDARHPTFSPDGARLVVITSEGPAVHVWDLRAIRRHLAGMGLDWDAPPYPDHDSADPSAPPLTLDPIDLGPLKHVLETTGEPPESIVERTTARLKADPNDAEARHQRGHALRSLRRSEEALTDFTAALVLRPDDAHLRAYRGISLLDLKQYGPALDELETVLRIKPETVREIDNLATVCNNQAWILATGPGPERNPAVAVRLAQLAVGLAPQEATYLNTLGVALYRAGQYAEAITNLEKSLAAAKGESDAFDLFFLAMARWNLGEIDQARADFDRAVRWRRDHAKLPAEHSRELDAFQAEAKALLNGPPPELPADVFAPSRS